MFVIGYHIIVYYYIFIIGFLLAMLRNVKLNVAFIALITILLAIGCIYVANADGINKDQEITIIVYMITAAAAIVSAYFVVVGYLINVIVFEASQTPAIRIFVGNSNGVNDPTLPEHITIITY